jgi:hypothetical protein
MSNSGESNFGFWLVIAVISAVILYFWREVLTFILELILGILNLIQNIVVEIISIAAFIGILYLISQIFKSKKK